MRRWPGRRGQPKPRIPARAEQRVTRRHKDGQKYETEFWLGGKVVGRAYWGPDGQLMGAYGLREGKMVGHRVEYDWDGQVEYAQPYVDGVPHGIARQYDPKGRVLIANPYRRGTGIDYWCYDQGRLAEEHPLVAGKPSGVERRWTEDQRSVYIETHWLDGALHGIQREWKNGALRRGFPRFFVRGERVTKRAYLAACRGDPSLPAYRVEEDAPGRALPEAFLARRRRARRQSAPSPRPSPASGRGGRLGGGKG